MRAMRTKPSPRDLGLVLRSRDEKGGAPSPEPARGASDMTRVPVTNEPAAERGAKPAFRIDSETVATVPARRSRRLLGLGEEVTLRTEPSVTATWSVSGGGTVSPATGSSITFTAPQDRATPVVQADAAGETATASFTVIRPHGLTSVVRTNTGPERTRPGPPNNRMGARTIFDCTVLPVSVSFDFAHFRENIPRQEFTWPDGTTEARGADLVEWQSTNNVIDDAVSTGIHPIGNLSKNGKEENFYVHIAVPEEFRDDAGTWVPWLPMEMHLREFIAGGKSRVTIEASDNVAGTWQGPWQ